MDKLQTRRVSAGGGGTHPGLARPAPQPGPSRARPPRRPVGAYLVDETSWPLARVTVPAEIDRPSVLAFLERVDAILARREAFAIDAATWATACLTRGRAV